jgi:hypothetical protein
MFDILCKCSVAVQNHNLLYSKLHLRSYDEYLAKSFPPCLIRGARSYVEHLKSTQTGLLSIDVGTLLADLPSNRIFLNRRIDLGFPVDCRCP